VTEPVAVQVDVFEVENVLVFVGEFEAELVDGVAVGDYVNALVAALVDEMVGEDVDELVVEVCVDVVVEETVVGMGVLLIV
jgi:hypothetical protein